MENFNERIRNLEREAVISRSDGAFELADDLQRQADILRERVAALNGLRAELLEIASDKSRALELAALMGRYSLEQQAERLTSALYSERLISPAQFLDVQRRLAASTPTEAKLQDEAAQERQKLDALMSRVLAAVDDRDRARQIYNELGGPRNEEKIRRWISRLAELRMLPKEVFALLRYSDWLAKLILPSENKLHQAARENK